MTPDPKLVERVAGAIDNKFPGVFRSQEECQDLARTAIVAVLTDPAITAGLQVAVNVIGPEPLQGHGLIEWTEPHQVKLTPLGHRLLEITKP